MPEWLLEAVKLEGQEAGGWRGLNAGDELQRGGEGRRRDLLGGMGGGS
jgi:hypothetical protein